MLTITISLLENTSASWWFFFIFHIRITFFREKKIKKNNTVPENENEKQTLFSNLIKT